MEYFEAIAKASLLNQAYRLTLDNMETLPEYITVQGELVDLKELRESVIQKFQTHTSGCNVELLCMYLHQNWERLPKDMQNSCASVSKTSHFAKESTSKGFDSTYDYIRSNRTAGKDYILGGKLFTSTTITKDQLITACQLLNGQHPWKIAMQKLMKSYKSANAVDLVDLDYILSAIDFPFTSISNLMRANDLTYIKSDDYIEDGLIVGTTRGYVVVYSQGTPKFHKVMTLDTFKAVYDLKIFSNKVTKKQAEAYAILEYSNGGSTHA